jgi:predicted HTH domain antitoxin
MTVTRMVRQERAAELAGLSRRDFLHALARQRVNVFNLDDGSLAREVGDASAGDTA